MRLLNTERINALIVEAHDLENQIDTLAMEGIKNPEYVDEHGYSTMAYLMKYDSMKAKLDGLYSRIGILMVSQTLYMQLIDGEWVDTRVAMQAETESEAGDE